MNHIFLLSTRRLLFLLKDELNLEDYLESTGDPGLLRSVIRSMRKRERIWQEENHDLRVKKRAVEDAKVNKF